jgi:hypothetical protein
MPFLDTHSVNLRPLIFIALLMLLYWDAPRVVPYATVFARRSIACVAFLLVPFLVYATVHQLSKWPFLTTTETVITISGGIGMFVGFCCAGICLILDAKRTPTE